MPDSLPDFAKKPEDPLPERHCKRCHRNTDEGPEKHNKICGGFTSECWPWCSPPGSTF